MTSMVLTPSGVAEIFAHLLLVGASLVLAGLAFQQRSALGRALTSPGICFAVNAASYLAVFAALGAMQLPPRPNPKAHGHILSGLREGLAYAWQSTPIRSLLLLIDSRILLPAITEPPGESSMTMKIGQSLFLLLK